MLQSAPTRPAKRPNRKQVIILLGITVLVLFAVLASQTAFNATILQPENNQQIVVLYALSLLISLLFVALFFVLIRNLLKVIAERRMGVLGSKFRTRMVAGGLLLSFVPVIVMYWFAYGLMNRSIDKWFSTPVEEVRSETQAMASTLAGYAMQNARAEAAAIAISPEIERAFSGHGFAGVVSEFQRHELTLQGGFAVAIRDGNAEASFNAPAPWPVLKSQLPLADAAAGRPAQFTWQQTDYTLGSAPVEGGGLILAAIPLPREFSQTVRQVEASQLRYFQLSSERRRVRQTYMGLLLLLTMIVLFVTTWLALFLAKLVTRPLAALAEATQEISRGRLDFRVDVRAADEIGDLVRSFNRMAEDLEASRRQIEASSRDLSAVNAELDQRRRQMETILESIPTGVLSLDADRRVTHVNQALLRMFHPDAGHDAASGIVRGASLADVFPADVLEDFEPLLRRADRMGVTTSQLEMQLPRASLNVAVTVATLRHQGERSGYVVVFEDLSDLLKAQKQAAWREVARRVAHEIKNPLTPIALSAERIQRHLDRAASDEPASLNLLRSCAETIAGAVETVRRLVDEFSTLARFPVANPQPADLNEIVEGALAMFNGRLDGINLHRTLAADLPKVMADSEAIKRAVANLVDNAAEALHDSIVREIEISTALVASRDAVEIAVADTGHGVTRELKEKLFLPYFSTKRRGTGLGLAIVSRIIEDHHGSIRVEENRPVGTRFIVELPVVPESAPTVTEPQHA
ncbi:Multi-sensor signal transduction histidine kinase [Candidatus Sulfotelmatobacter kueseliae]|uniref:histidine kinase n=1 Tax=Candidatus Sulfotelmatobacter kueseliae TaxID=2042962 RepID=A0A2U3KWT0_9BACT|nr:Multi-sensor signal transduction histidine kinase [Candidatus Sulfotelmatobacter kueseliae]